MELKIICPCGAHFAFEVEPENGAMPVPVACPECGVDATDLANQQIAAALGPAAAPGTAPPTRVDLSHARVRIDGPSSASIVAAAEATLDSPVQRCAKHATEVAVAECTVCGKPICQECVDQFGFLCSVYCRQQAENRGLAVPTYAGTKQKTRQRQRRKELRLLAAIPVGIAVLIAGWAYYSFYASRPRIAWSMSASAGKPFAHALWLDDSRVLSLQGDRLALLEATTGKPLWSTPLKPDESLPGDVASTPPLQVVKDAAWVLFSSRAVRFQLSDGQRKLEVPIPGTVEDFALSEGTAVASSSPAPERDAVTWIELASGQAHSEFFARALARATVLDSLADDDSRPSALFSGSGTQIRATARGAARVTARLLQAGSTTVNAPGQRERASVLEKETLRAGDSDAAGAEFLRNTAELRRLDVGRYAAAVRWFGTSPSPEWKSETIGRPALFPLPNVTVLIAGTNVVVFGPNGEKRWETRLAYPIDEQFTGEPSRYGSGPCREIGNRLYLADLANLATFDLNNGQVLWRAQAVGIRDIQPAPGGGIYVTATTAGPQAIVYVNPKEADVSVQPLLLKLDAGGQILWQQTGMGEHCLPVGKFLYVTRTQSSYLDRLKVGLGGDSTLHFRVHRLDPRNGRLLWEYYQPRAPLMVAPSRNRFFLLFRDELQMVRFASL